ncbi:MAG: pyrroline-5-carboxylate reductase [Cyanobacteria bacterium P01_H01_bin.121]
MKLGCIGGGVMAEAILARLLAQQLVAAADVTISEPQAERRQYWQATYQVKTTASNAETLQADILLLAIKPQIFATVVAEVQAARDRNPKQLVLSILAGTALAQLEAAFPNQPVMRVMPNTPATVGAGMSAIAPGQHVQSSHLEQAQQIFAAIGQVVTVSESLMDAVTGLSGSGPAYVALMIEALADGGVASGLPRAIAQQLALQTVLGTATFLQQQDLHPAILKDRVTSPGGTTIAGVATLEKAGFRSAIIEAVKTAATRSRELGQA